MHVVFDPDGLNWQELFAAEGSQVGYGYARFQLGGGYFEGTPYQRGHGLGSVFRSLWRFLLPLGKQAAASIGREGLETTSRVLNSVLDANNPTGLRESVRREAAAGAANLLNRASDHLRQQSGRGRRARAITSKTSAAGKPYKALYTRVGPACSTPARGKRKRTRVDALGAY